MSGSSPVRRSRWAVAVVATAGLAGLVWSLWLAIVARLFSAVRGPRIDPLARVRRWRNAAVAA